MRLDIWIEWRTNYIWEKFSDIVVTIQDIMISTFNSRMPTDDERKRIWASLLGWSKKCLKKMHYICSNHFDASDIFTRANGRKYIKKDAFPILQHTVFENSSMRYYDKTFLLYWLLILKFVFFTEYIMCSKLFIHHIAAIYIMHQKVASATTTSKFYSHNFSFAWISSAVKFILLIMNICTIHNDITVL